MRLQPVQSNQFQFSHCIVEMYFKVLLLLALGVLGTHQTNMRDYVDGLANLTDKVMYFAYGTDMYTKSMLMHSPNAVRVGPGLIKEYRLEFDAHSEEWHGAVPTLVPDEAGSVYGTMWHVDLDDLRALDEHEKVFDGVYTAYGATAESYGVEVFARIYMLDQPTSSMTTMENPPMNRRPSKTLLKLMVKGAEEAKALPSYVDFLKKIPHNNKTVQNWEEYFELEDVELFN